MCGSQVPKHPGHLTCREIERLAQAVIDLTARAEVAELELGETRQAIRREVNRRLSND
jgi:hypothetical protein